MFGKLTRRKAKNTSICIKLLLFLPLLNAGSWAADSGEPKGTELKVFQPSKGQFRIGAFFIRHVNTKIRINSRKGPIGTYLDTESDLGMQNDNSVPRLNFAYNFTPKHRLDAGWFNIERSGTKVIDKEIQLGDKTFPINAEVESYLNTEIFKVNYTYVFFNHPDASMGFGVGLHLTDIGIGIKTTDTPQIIQEDVGGLAPLPLLGFAVTYRINPKLFFGARSDLFFLSYDKYKGSMTDISLFFEFKAFKRVGIGLGWDMLSLSVEMDDDKLLGDFENTYMGALLYTAIYF